MHFVAEDILMHYIRVMMRVIVTIVILLLPSVLWRCWLGRGIRNGIWPVKNWVVGCWRGYLGWGADLHIAQQMPLPLTISCCSKSRLVLIFLVLPFWFLLTRVVPDIFQKSSKTVVCVCVRACLRAWVCVCVRCYIVIVINSFLGTYKFYQFCYCMIVLLCLHTILLV